MKYLYFSAQWCGPCKTLGPKMEQVAESVTVEKINVDEFPEVAQSNFVRNLPTVILVNENDVEQERFVGVKDVQFYLDKIKEYER